MRPTSLATALLTSGLFVTAQAQLIPFFTNTKPTQRLTHPNQHPMDPNNGPSIQLPPSDNTGKDNHNDGSNDRNGDVILSDVIGNSRQINIFASFTRDIDSVSKRLDTTSLNTTVLAPLNRAISDLPRKPWEDPQEYAALGASAYEGQDGEDRAHRNLRKFTEAHVVPESPWGEGVKVDTVGGSKIWWETKDDGKKVIMPGNVEIDGVVSKVANGEVWVLKSVLNYKG